MILNTILIALTMIACGLAVAVENWRWRIAALLIIQLFCFILIVQIWPIALASVKLVSGWIAATILGSSMIAKNHMKEKSGFISGKIFKLSVLTFGWIIILAVIQRLNEWLPIEFTYLFIGCMVLLTGIIVSSIHRSLFDVITGLVIFLSGFDVIYSSLEGSALVTGIYGLIMILISLLGLYFLGS